MIAVISFLIVILISILIIRIGSIALELTGLSGDVAKFQAQSAYTGVGFTTSEAEYVVSHPVRRRIIQILIFLGSAGIASAIVTLFLSFAGETKEDTITNMEILLIGIVLIYLFSRSKRIELILRKLIIWALTKYTSLAVHDYSQLLGLSRGYAISEIKVKPDSWITHKTLKELQLNKEGVRVLGIYRKRRKKEVYLGVPDGETKILPGDILVCYGHISVLEKLKDRFKGKKGDLEHEMEIIRAESRKAEERTDLTDTLEDSRSDLS